MVSMSLFCRMILSKEPATLEIIALAIGPRRCDEASCRRVERFRRAARIGDDWRERVGEFLSEFHAPLIEGVNVPNDTLNETLCSLEGNQLAKHARRHFFIEESA